MATPNLALPSLVEGQTNSETDVNTSLLLLDSLTAGRIEDKDLATPPTSPSNGQAWIVGTSASGAWNAKDGKVAVYNSGWTFLTPIGGQTMFSHDDGILWCYSSKETAWFPVQKYYSTAEHWTGRYGEGGAKIYAKSFAGLACPNNTTSTHSHSISNFDASKQVDFEASFTDGTTVSEFNFTQSSSILCYIKVNATNILITSNFNLSGSTADVRLEYTKTS